MTEKKHDYRKIVYNKYLSTHFAKLHNVDRIDEEYEKTYLYWKDYIYSYLPKNPEAHFLDIGCGLGHKLYALKKLGYKNVKGIDISPECAEFCKRKGFNVEERDIFDFLEDSNTSYDNIYGFDILEHFTKDEALQLINLVRLRLNKLGLFLILVPNANNLSNFRLRYMDITHEVFYTPESIRQLLLSGGFKNVEVVGLKHFSLSDKSILWMFLKIFIALPIYKLSEFFHKMFYLSQGLTDVNIVSPRILVVCKEK